MSLELTLSPTLDGMRRALDYSTTGLKVDAKYIGVGEGLQEIVLDGAKRAVTNRLKKPVAWLEILTAVRIDDYQHQMIVDLTGLRPTEWNFAECCLADENKDVIAIYGHPKQALMTVSPVIDRNFLAINMKLATVPAGSITIIHQNIPIELLSALDWSNMFNSVGSLAVTSMRQQLDIMTHSAALNALRTDLDIHIQQNAAQFNQIMQLHNADLDQQNQFNATVFAGIAALSNTALNQQIGVINGA